MRLTVVGSGDAFGSGHLVLTHLSATALASDLTSWQVAHDGLQLGV
jgi:hypothetical protein